MWMQWLIDYYENEEKKKKKEKIFRNITSCLCGYTET